MAAQYKFLLPTQECLFKECVQEDTDLQAAGMLRTAHSVLDKLWIKITHLELTTTGNLHLHNLMNIIRVGVFFTFAGYQGDRAVTFFREYF